MGTDNLETIPSTLEASGGHRSSPPGNVKLPFGRWVRVTGLNAEVFYVSKCRGIHLLFPERL